MKKKMRDQRRGLLETDDMGMMEAEKGKDLTAEIGVRLDRRTHDLEMTLAATLWPVERLQAW